jgi:hypothetical protein
MANQEVDYVKLLKDSFETGTKSENLVPLLVASLLSTVTLIFCPPFIFAMFRMALRATKGEKIEINQVWPGVEAAIRAFVLFFIIGIGVFVGSLLLVIPGLIFAFFTGLAPYVMAAEDASPIEAIKRSIEIVKASWVVVLVGSLIGAVIVGLGSVVPVVGSILLMPFAVLFMANIYGRVHALPAGAQSGQLQPGA